MFSEFLSGQGTEEFNRDTAVDMADDLRRRRAHDDLCADRGLAINVKRRPRHRDIDQGRGVSASVRKPKNCITVPGAMRSWRRSCGSPRDWRLASHVSWAVSLSRFAGRTFIWIANPLGKIRDSPLDPPDLIEISHDPLAELDPGVRGKSDAVWRGVDRFAIERPLGGKFTAFSIT